MTNKKTAAVVAEAWRRHMDKSALKEIFFRRKANLTPGVDRVNAESFERKIDATLEVVVRKVHEGKLILSPYLELLISKGKTSLPRVVARPTIRDKLILVALKEVLHDSFPAYVPRDLPNQVVREVLGSLKRHGSCEIVRVDIKSFYDSIPHARLGKSLTKIAPNAAMLSLLLQSIKVAVVPPFHRKEDLAALANRRGVPQGLPISNYLANFYLRNLDQKMRLECLSYHRYVDDIVIIARHDEGKNTLKSLSKKLRPLGLAFNDKKTQTVDGQGVFEFLGYQVKDGKARPRQKSVERFIRSVASLFSMLRQERLPRRQRPTSWSDEDLANMFVEELNEKITGAISGNKQYGWVFYYNESTDLSVFGQIDAVVKRMARSTDLLTNAQRRMIKSTIRTYWESRHSKASGYIFNYELIKANWQKSEFLWRKGYFDKAQVGRMSPERIELEFSRVVSIRLAGLDQDIGVVS